MTGQAWHVLIYLKSPGKDVSTGLARSHITTVQGKVSGQVWHILIYLNSSGKDGRTDLARSHISKQSKGRCQDRLVTFSCI